MRPVQIGIDRVLQWLHEPWRTADLIHAGFDPLAIQVNAALGTVDRGHFSRRQWAARTDRGGHRSGAATGGEPHILGCAGNIEQRGQRRVGRRHLVFKTIQKRFDDRDDVGNAGQEAFEHRCITRAQGHTDRTIGRSADVGKLDCGLVEAFDDRGAIAESADHCPGIGEGGIRLMHYLCNRIELGGCGCAIPEQRRKIRCPMAGYLLTHGQHRSKCLHRLERFGLAGKGTILRYQNQGGEDDRQGRHRKH